MIQVTNRATCVCGDEEGSNRDCERCGLINRIGLLEAEVKHWIARVKELRGGMELTNGGEAYGLDDK